MNGWIKLHRCLIEKAVWQNHNVFRVFTWCLMKATHKPIEQMVGMTKVLLLPGQFVYGRMKASEETGLAQSTVRNCINWLKQNNTLDIKPDNKKSVITIINWASYQSDTEEVDSKQDITLDNNRTTTGQQQDTNKKVKKIKKDSLEPKKRTIINDYFDLWLEKYGEKPALTQKAIILLHGDVKSIGYEKVLGRMKMYFKDTEKFVVDSRHDVSIFHSRINRYVVVEDDTDPNSAYQQKLRRELEESRRVTF